MDGVYVAKFSDGGRVPELFECTFIGRAASEDSAISLFRSKYSGESIDTESIHCEHVTTRQQNEFDYFVIFYSEKVSD